MIFTKLQSRLDEIAENLAEELDPVVEEAAEMVASRARSNLEELDAVDTGRLRSSIKVIRYDTCQYNVVADAVAPQATTPLPYGIFVEYGTERGGNGGGNAPPQPFLGPAAEDSKDDVLEMVNQKLDEL